jgi:hypothetical protein
MSLSGHCGAPLSAVAWQTINRETVQHRNSGLWVHPNFKTKVPGNIAPSHAVSLKFKLEVPARCARMDPIVERCEALHFRVH